MNNTRAFLTALADEVGALLQSRFKPGGTATATKSDNTALTEADLAADRLIQQRIREQYPDDYILSEEGDTRYPQTPEPVWVIDPLDGTTNFAIGLHHWGVSIARLENGVPSAAALNFPLLGELYTAVQGEGAWLNGEPLYVEKGAGENPFSVFACCSRTFRNYHVRVKYKSRILGSAAYNLVSVARGSAALAFEVRPKVWDLAAAWLIVRQAGGVIAPLDGSEIFPLQAGTDYGQISFPTLAAPTQEQWEAGRKHITPRR